MAIIPAAKIPQRKAIAKKNEERDLLSSVSPDMAIKTKNSMKR